MNYGRLASLLCGLSLATSSSLSAQSADAPPVPSRADVAGAVVRTVATELLDSIPYRRIALAISGGISKGSYQAGVAFGIVRVARDLESAALRRDGHTTFPTIVASTGASAGNIIAVLLAVDYCRAELGLAEESSLARAWLPVGRERLLVPRESNNGFRKRMAPSSVLSQEYLRDSIGLLLSPRQ